ncbi:MAG: substrate-binding domain-containing protein [Paracoccaceae bacterium]
MFINFGARLRVALPILATATLGFAAGAHAEGEPVLGVALPNLTNPYYVAMKKSFEDNGAAQGFEVRVLIADNDDAKQLAQVQTFVEAGVNAVALNCVSSGPCVASVQELNAANIPVFTVNLLPDAQGLKDVGATVVQAVETDQAWAAPTSASNCCKTGAPAPPPSSVSSVNRPPPPPTPATRASRTPSRPSPGSRLWRK